MASHFDGDIVFFPPSSILCLLRTGKSIAQSISDCKWQHHPSALSGVRQQGIFFFPGATSGLSGQGGHAPGARDNFVSQILGQQREEPIAPVKSQKHMGWLHIESRCTHVSHVLQGASQQLCLCFQTLEKKRCLLSLTEFASWRKFHHGNGAKIDISSNEFFCRQAWLWNCKCAVGHLLRHLQWQMHDRGSWGLASGMPEMHYRAIAFKTFRETKIPELGNAVKLRK